MKQLGVTDIQELAKILRNSQLLEVKEDGKMVKRKDPLPGDDKNSIPKTVLTKGWPSDITLETIENALSSHGKIVCIRIRKGAEKKPNGSVFVEFELEEDAKKLLSLGNIMYNETQISLKSKEEWFNSEKEKKEKNGKKSKKRKSTEEPTENDDNEEKKEPKNEKGEEEEKEKKEEKVIEHQKGVVLSFSGIGPNQRREDLRAIFQNYGSCQFVDFQKDSSEGYVRFDKPEEVQKAIEEISEKVEIGGKIPLVKALSGEEEENYWKTVTASKNNKKGKGGRGRGRGGRGGRGRGGKRRRF